MRRQEKSTHTIRWRGRPIFGACLWNKSSQLLCGDNSPPQTSRRNWSPQSNYRLLLWGDTRAIEKQERMLIVESSLYILLFCKYFIPSFIKSMQLPRGDNFEKFCKVLIVIQAGSGSTCSIRIIKHNTK